MHTEEQVKVAMKLHESVRQFRGRILNSIAVIDVRVANILTGYFCENEEKRGLLLSEVFTSQSFGFRAKCRLLEKIVKKDCAFFLDNEPDTFSELNKLRELRNDLAHSTLDTTDAAIEKAKKGNMGFVFFKNGKRHVKTISREQAENYEVRVNMVSGNIKDIGKLFNVVI